MQLLCEIDRHRESTGRKHYVAQTPEEEAATARMIFETFFGAAIEFPSADEYAKLKRPLSTPLKRKRDSTSSSISSVSCGDDHSPSNDGELIADESPRKRAYVYKKVSRGEVGD